MIIIVGTDFKSLGPSRLHGPRDIVSVVIAVALVLFWFVKLAVFKCQVVVVIVRSVGIPRVMSVMFGWGGLAKWSNIHSVSHVLLGDVDVVLDGCIAATFALGVFAIPDLPFEAALQVRQQDRMQVALEPSAPAAACPIPAAGTQAAGGACDICEAVFRSQACTERRSVVQTFWAHDAIIR